MLEISSMIAIIIALTQLVKDTGFPSRFAPIFSLTVGIALAMFFTEGPPQFKVINGVLMGLSSSGLYDAVKYPVVAKLKGVDK